MYIWNLFTCITFLLYVKYNIVMELCNRINTVEVFEVIYTHIKMGMLTKDILWNKS